MPAHSRTRRSRWLRKRRASVASASRCAPDQYAQERRPTAATTARLDGSQAVWLRVVSTPALAVEDSRSAQLTPPLVDRTVREERSCPTQFVRPLRPLLPRLRPTD